VTTYEYDVLLSYPDYSRPNQIHKWDEKSDAWAMVSNGLAKGPEERENPLEPEGADTSAVLWCVQSMHRILERVWWNAYARNGTVEGRIVYVNYGSMEDFELLDSVGHITNYSRRIMIDGEIKRHFR
jgi:hypothetical protein